MKSKLHEYKETYEVHTRGIKHPQPRGGFQFFVKNDGNLSIQNRGKEMTLSPGDIEYLMDVFRELGFGNES